MPWRCTLCIWTRTKGELCADIGPVEKNIVVRRQHQKLVEKPRHVPGKQAQHKHTVDAKGQTVHMRQSSVWTLGGVGIASNVERFA